MPTSESPLFTDTQKTLFGMLSQSLFDRDFTPDEDTDWAADYRESCTQAVNLLAFNTSQKFGIPDELTAQIKQSLRQYVMRDTVIHNCHTRIHELMTANRIPYVILKGAASAYYYPNPFLRGMGDVDFYVPEAYVEQAESILEENGFNKKEIDSDHHTVLVKQGVKYEVHREIPGVPKGRMGEIIREYRSDIIEQAILTKTEVSTFLRPSQFHHGLILLLHTQQHLLNEGLGLRHICDWAVFVHSFQNGEFPEMFQEKLNAVGLWKFARILSLVAVTATGLPQEDWMEEKRGDKELADALLGDFLEGGNFGVKDEDRSRVYESMLLSDPKKSDLNRSRAGNALESVNDWIRQRWPLARKCPLLLPFGWVYFLLRRFWLVLTGKKKRIRIGKTLRNSGRRQDLYKKLALFQAQS